MTKHGMVLKNVGKKRIIFKNVLCKNAVDKFAYKFFQCNKSKFFRMYAND